MHLGAAFVADVQSFELVEVREGALDDPADAAKPGAVLAAALCDHGFDPACAQQPPVRVVVIATVSDQLVGGDGAAGPAGRRRPAPGRAAAGVA